MSITLPQFEEGNSLAFCTTPLAVNLETPDSQIARRYLVGIVATGWLVAWRQKRRQRAAADAPLLGGKRLGWASCALAMFAIGYSAQQLASLFQNVFDAGLLHGNYLEMVAFPFVLMGFCLALFHTRSHIMALPEFIEKRYNQTCRDCLPFVSIITGINALVRCLPAVVVTECI
ncbi:hypothetical protein AB1K70_23135 [Bremerella sp. JC770]|uniref:hypothetical protein n=1 Tax=Bremerella sp. JC770 TaxID=3232137 RepID=UPI00345842F2